MDKKEFNKVLENIFSSYGFQLKNKAFYHDNDEFITVITIQKSNYDNSYYINYGFIIKKESPEIKYPKETDCDIFARVSFEANGKRYHSIDLNKFNAETLSTSIIEYCNLNIKPAIDSGLPKYLEINPKAAFTMTLKAKKYLEK